MRKLHLISLTAGCLWLAMGCLPEQRFMTPDDGGPWLLAIQEDTPAFFESEDGNLYLVEQRVMFEFREPTDEEVASQADIGEMQIPYAQLPWLQRGDYEIQVDWTLSNVSDQTLVTAVILNGINEFHEYNPGVQVVENDVIPDFSGWERNLILGPGERVGGTIREEELDEIAVDLASVVNMAPNPNQITYFENNSAIDERTQAYIPDVVPALTGLRMGLRSSAAIPVVLEATIRIRDLRGVLVEGENEPWVAPTPALFGPADAAAAMMMTPTP